MNELVSGLGRTVQELDIGNVKPIEKTMFSMCTPDLMSHVKEKAKGKQWKDLNWPLTISSIPLDFNTAIICGIEAHACVLQTTIDLLAENYRVYIVADAVSSRSLTDR